MRAEQILARWLIFIQSVDRNMPGTQAQEIIRHRLSLGCNEVTADARSTGVPPSELHGGE